MNNQKLAIIIVSVVSVAAAVVGVAFALAPSRAVPQRVAVSPDPATTTTQPAAPTTTIAPTTLPPTTTARRVTTTTSPARSTLPNKPNPTIGSAPTTAPSQCLDEVYRKYVDLGAPAGLASMKARRTCLPSQWTGADERLFEVLLAAWEMSWSR